MADALGPAWRDKPAAIRAADPAQAGSALELRRPWTLPRRGLAVFHGSGDVARLSHYFLPRLLLEGKRVLFLDGANSADPRLLARLARERGVAFEQFSQRMEIARAFTCFQLTELVARVPRLLEDFPAEVLVVTALPDLYYDEDVRDWDARVAFEQALRDLRQWAVGPLPTPGNVAKDSARQGMVLTMPRAREFDVQRPSGPEAVTTAAAKAAHEGGFVSARLKACPDVLGSWPLAVAVFSAAPRFGPSPARRRFFDQTCAEATEVWQFRLGQGDRLELACTRRCQVSGVRFQDKAISHQQSALSDQLSALPKADR